MQSVKGLLAIVAISLAYFALVGPIARTTMSEAVWRRRRLAWLVLVAAAMLSPSIWLYSVIAVPLLLWMAARDPNPLAVYFIALWAVPPMQVPIPFPGLNLLFSLSPARILALFLLLPAVLRAQKAAPLSNAAYDTQRHPIGPDLAILAYGVLQLVLYAPFENWTNSLRRCVLYLLDVYLLYYAFSRRAANREALDDTIATFCLWGGLGASFAIFETAKRWLLFTDIPQKWGAGAGYGAYLLRGDSLRAQVTAGHSLVLGFMLTVALLLCVNRVVTREYGRRGLVMVFILLAGTVASYARAAWLVSAFGIFLLMLLNPAARRRAPAIIACAVVGAIGLAFTPLGPKLLKLLPFIGTDEQGNIDYRKQLWEVSLGIIKNHPLFGDPYALQEMESLRQGDGIIDIVNSYIGVTLTYGIVGLTLFAIGVFSPAYRLLIPFARLRADRVARADLATLTIATTAMAIIIATVSLLDDVNHTLWSFAGISTAALVVASRLYRETTAPSLRPLAARRYPA